MELSTCVGCGAVFPVLDGPTHPYLESSPACWATYGEVLSREYSDPAYFRVHKLSVDSYAVQHPGRPSAQSIQSVALHLIRLHMMLERNQAPDQATAIMQAAAKNKTRFVWLESPTSLGAITVADVHGASSADEHGRSVRPWAVSAWAAWATHHEIVREWARDAMAVRRSRKS